MMGWGQLRKSWRARTKAAAIAEPVETPSHRLLLMAPTTTPERIPTGQGKGTVETRRTISLHGPSHPS